MSLPIAEIESQISKMLDFSNSEEFFKDFEIFLCEPFPERGPAIKIIYLFLTLYIDELIKNNNLNEIKIWLLRL